jgi:hypothetical protein
MREPIRDKERLEHILESIDQTGYILNRKKSEQKVCRIEQKCNLCIVLKGLPKRDFGILTTRNQGNQV